MATPNDHERFMRMALAEARKASGLTSPNPAVGAVLVSKNKIVARGHHRGVGLPHAEIECLTTFGRDIPKNATLYVTLEPCSTIGRTGPCTDAIINSGVRKIVVGTVDPNPKHSGRGIDLLKKGGLEVAGGIFFSECNNLNEKKKKKNPTTNP